MMIMFLYDLEQDFLAELKECLNVSPNTEISDVISEVAESHIPIYYFDLLCVARRNLWLAVEEPEIPVTSAVQAISYNLYNHLVEL